MTGAVTGTFCGIYTATGSLLHVLFFSSMLHTKIHNPNDPSITQRWSGALHHLQHSTNKKMNLKEPLTSTKGASLNHDAASLQPSWFISSFCLVAFCIKPECFEPARILFPSLAASPLASKCTASLSVATPSNTSKSLSLNINFMAHAARSNTSSIFRKFYTKQNRRT